MPPINLGTTRFSGNGAGGTRTHDLRFRKPSLYPAELQPPGDPLWNPKAGEVIAIRVEVHRGIALRNDSPDQLRRLVEESPGSPMARLAG